jgi:hypothetical protein
LSTGTSSFIILANSGGNAFAGSTNGSYVIYSGGNASSTTGAGASLALTIDSSQNVGIGVSPVSTLSIQNSQSTAANNTTTGSIFQALSPNSGIFMRNRGASAGIGGANYSTQLFTDSGAGNFEIYNIASSADLIFGTNATERIRIDSSGNVGIGTTSPGTFYPGNHNLVVGDGNADSAITVYSNSANTGYLLFADGTSGSSSYTAQVRYNHSTNHMEFATNNSTSAKMTLDDNGNVGIGTTSPGRKLTVTGDVSGDANNLLLANENDTDGDSASIGFSMLSNNTYVKSGIFFKRTATQGRGDLIFANNNEVNGNNVTLSDAKITIQPGGNVGIGTNSPQKNLQIFQTEGGVGAKHATIRLGGYSTVGPDIAAYRVTGNSNDQGLIFSTYDATNGTVDTMTLTNAGASGS